MHRRGSFGRRYRSCCWRNSFVEGSSDPHWSSSGALNDNKARPLSKCPFRIILHSWSNQNEIILNFHAAQKEEDKWNKGGRGMNVHPVQPFWSMVVHTSEHITADTRALHVRVWRVLKKKAEMKDWSQLKRNFFPSLPVYRHWSHDVDVLMLKLTTVFINQQVVDKLIICVLSM